MSALSIGTELASVPFDQMIRNLLLAMVDAQNDANTSFIKGVQDLVETPVNLSYTKAGDSCTKTTISGNALAFGVLPTLLSIQSSTIEIRTALSVTKNTATSGTGKNVRERAGYLFKTNSVDAKYQNTYSYKAESSSVIRITVVPTPPTQALMEAIKSVTKSTPIADNPKP